MSSSIPSWQILTVHAQPVRGTRDLASCLKVPLDSLLLWASSGGSGETARMRRLAWTFAAHIGDKYQIRLTRSILCFHYPNDPKVSDSQIWANSILLPGLHCLSFCRRLLDVLCKFKQLFSNFRMNTDIFWGIQIFVSIQEIYKWATLHENVSSGIFDLVRFKPSCSATEAS